VQTPLEQVMFDVAFEEIVTDAAAPDAMQARDSRAVLVPSAKRARSACEQFRRFKDTPLTPSKTLQYSPTKLTGAMDGSSR